MSRDLYKPSDMPAKGLDTEYARRELSKVAESVRGLSTRADEAAASIAAVEESIHDHVTLSQTSSLASDIALATSSVWYTASSIVLPSGTWLVNASISFRWTTTSTGSCTWYARILSASTSVASQRLGGYVESTWSRHAAFSLLLPVATETTVRLQGKQSVNNTYGIIESHATESAMSTYLQAIPLDLT